jgi:two-component system, LytTR family, response regulator
MIKAIAVDDEPVALDVIKNHAEKVPFLELEKTFLSATDAFDYIREKSLDLIFLDISMPGLSGLELAEMIKHRAQVVFTTAYPEHALKGFELAATDYLLKPINFSRFLQACQLAESRAQAEQSRADNQDSLFVKDGHTWLAVKLSELLYIRGEDNYASLFVNDKRILTRMTLTELQSKLPANQFLRIHKSYIVALSKIEKLEKHQVTIGEVKIPLSMVSADFLLQILRKKINPL